MPEYTPSKPSFSVAHESSPSDVLIAGFSSFGLAGLTAVDYLIDNLDLEETGHIRTDGLPSITPFSKGRPRHPIRLYSAEDIDVTVLVAEQFVPAALGELLATSILEWTESAGVSEIAVLAGVPIPHGPDAHRTFYVATDDYRETRLGGGENAPEIDADDSEGGAHDSDINASDSHAVALDDADRDTSTRDDVSETAPAPDETAPAPDGDTVPPMEAGFLDGTNASLLERGMDSPLGVGVFITPVHAQAPDVEAAVRLVDTIDATYGLGVDSEPLASFAAEIRRHYEGLAERIEEREPEGTYDRMYM
ncbi:proteasome assembly chaperone family protein [Halorubrum sp. DTA46]|uniref:proteasome assembly chaperone family protein n=1 Tax=Halorubrum sp. DTA46 TaxID=3402162 RepID=UPI003AB0FA99